MPIAICEALPCSIVERGFIEEAARCATFSILIGKVGGEQ
jgi:hypothetical protein